MGALCDLDQNNVIMVNIEELSEEDQRSYAALQEYVKQQFLSGAKKDRQGKVTIAQDFGLPAIKLNNDKVEVVTTVSQPETDLLTQLSTISDKFDRAFSVQNNLVASVITRLEKVEGKRVSSDISDGSIPHLDSQGVLHPNLSTTSGASTETPLYGMPTGFYPGQSSLPKPTPVRPPLMAG